MSSNPSSSSQPDQPTPADLQAFIEYSRTLREYTLGQWLLAVKASEERRLLLLEQEQNASQSPQPLDPQDLMTVQQPTQASTSSVADNTNEDPKNIPLTKDQNKPS